MAAIWNEGALPFETTEPAVCDGIAQGHYGMTFSLASRNITTALLVAHVEAHAYDAALLLDSCDKRPVADLAAVVEIDTYRRRRGKKPFYACFIPAHVMPESHLPPEIAEGIRALRGKAGPAYDDEIDALLLHRLKCNTYAMFKKLLDGLEAKGALPARRARPVPARDRQDDLRGGRHLRLHRHREHRQGRAARPRPRAALGGPAHEGGRATRWSATR